MFGKRINTVDIQLFFNINLPTLVDHAEGLKGQLLYELKKGNLSEADLSKAFPEEYPKFKKILEEKSGFGFFDKKNYVLDYFFAIHNKERQCKVVPAQVLGFKAERKGMKNELNVRVKFHDNSEAEGISIFPTLGLGSFNLKDYVLIHNNHICHVLTPLEYKEIVENYF